MGNYGIRANVISDTAFRSGAKVWITRIDWGDPNRPEVTGISKGGRRITKRMSVVHLTNYRSGWVPNHMRPDRGPVSLLVGAVKANEIAARLARTSEVDE